MVRVARGALSAMLKLIWRSLAQGHVCALKAACVCVCGQRGEPVMGASALMRCGASNPKQQAAKAAVA